MYEGWRWPTFAEGVAAVRAIAQSGIQPTVLRLSDESESAVNLADPDAIGGSSGGGVGGCLMVVGFEGAAARVAERRAGVTELLTGLGGAPGGEEPGRAWEHGRFRAPYLRDSLLDLGVLVETLETATFWSGVEDLYAGVKAALEAELAVTTADARAVPRLARLRDRLLPLLHGGRPPGRRALEQWARAKRAASDAIVARGATITHHHAIGTDHLPWLEAEIGPVGVRILRAVKAELDPTGVLSPGVLVL